MGSFAGRTVINEWFKKHQTFSSSAGIQNPIPTKLRMLKDEAPASLLHPDQQFNCQVPRNIWRKIPPPNLLAYNLVICSTKVTRAKVKQKATSTLLGSCRYLPPRHVTAAILGLIKPEIVPFDPPILKILSQNQTWSVSYHCCGDIAIQNSTYHEGCIWDNHIGEEEVIGGHWSYRSKERWWFLIGSPLWLLCYLWPFEGVGHFGLKFWVFPLENRHVVGVCREWTPKTS